jgi:hypothetical protein
MFSEKCCYKLCIDPVINLRPYEIEAYGKDRNLCSRIRDYKEFKEFEDIIMEASNKVREWIAYFMLAHKQH